MLLETTSGLDITISVVIVFQVIVCLLLILVVMMQRPKQEGLGAAFGGDTLGELAGAHAADFLQKGTAWLGTLLFLLTFTLAMLVSAANADKNRTLKNESEKPSEEVEKRKNEQTSKPDVEKHLTDSLNEDESTEDEAEVTEKVDDVKAKADAEAKLLKDKAIKAISDKPATPVTPAE